MESDHSTIISDSEPEGYPTSSALSAGAMDGTAGSVFLARAMRAAAKQQAQETESVSSKEASAQVGPKGKGRARREEVLVLSSGGESDEDAQGKKPSTSRYFAPSGSPTGTKRRRVPFPRPAGEGWPSLASLSAVPRSPPTRRPSHGSPYSSSSSQSVYSIDRSLEIARAATSGPYTTFSSDTRQSPAPFVSALDLLRSTPSQVEESDAELVEVRPKKGKVKVKEQKPKKVPRPRPTVKKRAASGKSTGTSKTKQRSASLSSAEAIDEIIAARDGADEDEDDRRSIASTSSSTSSLPAPSTWKERFQLGAKPSKDSLLPPAGPDVKPKRPLEARASLGAGQRKKPWEDLETMIANRPRVKPPSVPATKSSKSKKPVKAESTPLHSSAEEDDDAVIVVNATVSPHSTTAFLPLPSLRSSSSTSLSLKPLASSTKTAKKPTAAPLSFLPTPLRLPSDDRLRALTSCILCHTSWPTSKSLSVRQTHLRSCASKQLHTAETVALLVDDEVLKLAEQAEERRREREEGLSLFDRAVGKGEGVNAWREVTVVGVEGLGAEGGGVCADQAEWGRKTKKVQEELDQGRRKDKAEKVVKVAKEIRRERAAAATADDGEIKPEQVDRAVEGDDASGDESSFPASTGRLRPDSETARAAVAKRANELLGLAGGTGLTQAAAPLSVDAVRKKEEPTIDFEAGIGGTTAFSSPPRPTQSFEPSDLALRYESEGKADVLRLSSRPMTSNSRSRSPSFLLWDEEESGSLWKGAAGKDEDDEVVRRVVSPPLSPAALPGSSPSPARSFTLHRRHARTASAPSPARDDLGIGLSPSSNRLFSTLALSSPSASSTFGSPIRPQYSHSRARSLSHPYPPLSVRSFRSRSASPVTPTRSRGGSSAAFLRRASLSPTTAKTMEEMGRLGLEEGETVGVSEEAPEEDEVEWREEVEGWLMEGGMSPERNDVRQEAETRSEEESSEEEPLASATKRARSKKANVARSLPLPPSSPSPTAAKTIETKTKKGTSTASSIRRRKAAAPSSPGPPAAPDHEEDDFAFRSDDSLPPPPARRANTATRPQPAAAAANSAALSATADPLHDPPGMPSYSTFALTKLQKEVAKYGFRPSKEKSVMIEQMKGIWRALNPDAVEASSAAVPATAAGEVEEVPVQKRGRKRATSKAAETDGQEKTKPKPRGRRKKTALPADEDGGEGEVEEDARAPGERLRELILADEALYCRILRYEPIHLDEFTALVKNGGVKIAQQLLMRCLDEQSITFYSQDPTNGSRRRYK